jgi:hypothetical protein
VDRVAFLRLGQSQLTLLALKAVAPVGEPVGPRDQRRAVGAVADGVEWIRVQDIPIPDRILPYAPANLDDRGSLLAVGDLKLLS